MGWLVGCRCEEEGVGLMDATVREHARQMLDSNTDGAEITIVDVRKYFRTELGLSLTTREINRVLQDFRSQPSLAGRAWQHTP